MPHAPHIYPQKSVYASCSQYVPTHFCHLFPMYITAHIYASFSHVCSHTLMLSFTHIYPHLYAFCSPCIPTDICLMLPIYTYTHILYMLHVPTHIALCVPFTNTYMTPFLHIYPHNICFTCPMYQHAHTCFMYPMYPYKHAFYVYPHLIASFVPCIYINVLVYVLSAP